MNEINTASDLELENPSIDTLKEIYSHQDRDCWLCKEYASKLEAGKELKEEELWHFTNCIMSWEKVNQGHIIVEQPLEKAA